MAFFSGSVFALLFCLLQVHNAFSEESNKEYYEHVTYALHKGAEAELEYLFSYYVMKDSVLYRRGSGRFYGFRLNIVSNYNVKDKSVNECVHNILVPLRKKGDVLHKCDLTSEYSQLQKETFSKLTVKKIEEKTKEVCKDVEKEKPEKIYECAEKGLDKLKKDEGCTTEQVKGKLDEIYKKSAKCTQELKETYDYFDKQLEEKCSK